MTRKDYKLIAAVLHEARINAFYRDGSRHPGSQTETIEALAMTMADALKGENSRFKPDTFLKACGM